MNQSFLKYLFISALVIYPFRLLKAQQIDLYRQIDSSSYAQYLNKDWTALRKTAKTAAKNNIDYYYLRMRLGVTHFERQNYLRSIPQFKKALKFNLYDPIAAEYLYYAYLNSGRKESSQLISKSYKNSLSQKVKTKTNGLINTDVYFAGTANSKQNLSGLVDTALVPDEDGYQQITRNMLI